ncbi:MAG: DUF433 domain-containing protein [Armatimonadetes bacterium]|nr:DUF433 domain-containing protein [Armatimonadota bacterium]
MKLDRITFSPNILAGKACIRGMRITVSLIVNLTANGMNRAEILEAYPDLEDEDITQALKYAAWVASDQVTDAA